MVRMWRTDTGANIFGSSTESSMQTIASEIVSLQCVSKPENLLIARADCSIELTEIQVLKILLNAPCIPCVVVCRMFQRRRRLD